MEMLNGSHLQGTVHVSYDRLVEAFSEPYKWDLSNSDGKSDVEWIIEFDDGTIATIYDWKRGVNYCGPVEGIPAHMNTLWNIGGHSKDAVQRITAALLLNEDAQVRKELENSL
jgi:hypothetical protein